MTPLAPNPAVSTFRASHLIADRYRLQHRLAWKQWGKVYLAEDCRPPHPHNNRCIVYHLDRLSSVANYVHLGRDLLTPEARILRSAGQHPQIPTFWDFFEQENGFYWVQEAIAGHPLSLELATAPWSTEAVLHFLRAVLTPLAVVHRQGGHHGNLKPENLVRRADNQALMLIDFQGLIQIQLALLAAQGTEIPRSNAAHRGYQPLEQLQGLPCAASDIYAVGMMAVQALTGKLPTTFPINPVTVEILWQSHLPEIPDSPLRSPLVDVLHHMVQWDVSRRLATADHVLQALNDFAPVAAAVGAGPAVATITIPANPIAPDGEISPAAIAPPVPNLVGLEWGDRPKASLPDVDREAEQGQNLDAATIALPATPWSVPVYPDDPPNPQLTPLKTLLVGALTSPSLYLGIGGMAVASACAAVGWGMLTSIEFNDRATALQERLQRALAEGATARHHTARRLGQRWWQDWQRAANSYQAAEQAVQEGRWYDAQQAAATMPDIPFWRDRWQGLAHQVIAKAETQAQQLLQTAYDHARERRFNRAIAELEQITPGTSMATLVSTKKDEYRAKQMIKAWADLQKAYDQATVRDFSHALTYLYQIPANTPAYAIAQQKITEYRQKEKIRAQYLLDQANRRARQQNLTAAISTLNNAPVGTELDPVVDAKIAQYKAQLNQRADQLLQLAKRQQALGQSEVALAMLYQIPLGTTAYAEARDLLAIATAPPPAPAIAHQPTLNPGTHLREARAIAHQAAPLMVK